MRKNTLFISAALTTFMLAIMVGAASAYQDGQLNSVLPAALQAAAPSAVEVAPAMQPVPQQVEQAAAEPMAQPAAVDSVAKLTEPAVEPTDEPALVSPEEAAQIASETLGRNDLYSVELTQFEGVDAYLVTFSSGDLVYVGMDGQALSTSKVTVAVVSSDSGNNGKSGNSGSHDDHEDNDHEDNDHEDNDD